MATAAAFHLDSGDTDGARTGSTSGIRAAGAEEGNEVAAGSVGGRREAYQGKCSGGGRRKGEAWLLLE